jgi:hypothetical protein
MRILIRVAALLLVAAAAGNAHAQRLAVVTTVMPGTRMPLTAAQDLVVDLDAGTVTARRPGPIDGSYPNQTVPHAVVATSDGRYVVGAHERLPITVPITFPLAYRDTVTGASGTIVEDVSRIAVATRRTAVFVGFWNGDVGIVDAAGIRRVHVCDGGSTASALAAARDTDEILVACSTSLRVLDGRTGAELRRLTLASSPSEMHVVAGNRLFTLDYAGPVVFAVMEMSVYDLTSGARLANRPTPIAGRGLTWATPSPDGARVAVGVSSSVVGFAGTPHIVDSATAAVLTVWPVDLVTKLAFTTQGSQAVLVREIPQGPNLDDLLGAALVDADSGSVVAQGILGVASYPAIANLVLLEAPLAPALLPPQVSNSEVTLSWQPAPTSRAATDYVIEAGSSPNSFELLSRRLGTDATTFAARGVPRGRYYVRVRAVNAVGVSQPSTVVEVQVP